MIFAQREKLVSSYPSKEFFSRGFDSVISGTSDWKTIRTVFELRTGEVPDQIKLNVVVNGVGTIWIDDIHLSKI